MVKCACGCTRFEVHGRVWHCTHCGAHIHPVKHVEKKTELDEWTQ